MKIRNVVRNTLRMIVKQMDARDEERHPYDKPIKNTNTTGTLGVPGTVSSITSGNTTNGFVFSAPSVVRLPPADQLLNEIVEKIDDKMLADYDFRELMRDNLSTCEYNVALGLSRYQRPDETHPISILDLMILNRETL